METKIEIIFSIKQITPFHSDLFFWRYEAGYRVLGKYRFLTYADSPKEAKRVAMRRLKKLLLDTAISD